MRGVNKVILVGRLMGIHSSLDFGEYYDENCCDPLTGQKPKREPSFIKFISQLVKAALACIRIIVSQVTYDLRTIFEYTNQLLSSCGLGLRSPPTMNNT